ncbi:MAG: methionine--tRNA ligase [Candidatus Paceibacterota bacterium]|jgi:methionyl-tRNA synthetase
MSKPFYITTTLPYVNADPHIGFAVEIIRADIIARYHKLAGEEVFFNTGVDEHGQKIYQKALERGQDPQVYVGEWSEKFRELIKPLGISADVNFVRTTDPGHIKAAQEFWRVCDQNGYIYKKNYQVKYCVGCELEKTESELVDGKCPLHPNLELELRDEENYFFKFSEFQNKLLALYDKNPDFVLPPERFHEIRKFIEAGLQDFSISRLKSKMPWGIEVPGDSEQVMYVWFDALVNYISVIGWPYSAEASQGKPDTFHKWWIESGGAVQYCGKDNLRQQTAMWQAMLMAAGLPNSQKVIVEGFITSGGQKMSKSLGNVINPQDIVKEYGTDALRYFVAREFSSFEDSDFTWERFKEAYNAGLANGLGNLASRILTLAEKYLDKCPEIPEKSDFTEYFKIYESYDLQKVANYVWDKIQALDKKIQTTEPFKVVKVDEVKGKAIIEELVLELYTIARMLNPLMPETNVKLKELIKANKKPETPLFLRKD